MWVRATMHFREDKLKLWDKLRGIRKGGLDHNGFSDNMQGGKEEYQGLSF